MKLSCSTNSPGAYADTRARCRAWTNGARSSCFTAASTAARGRRSQRETGSQRATVLPAGAHERGGRCTRFRSSASGPVRAVHAGPVDRADRPAAAARRPRGDASASARAGWVVGVACARDHERGAGARPLPPRLRAAGPGRLGDAGPGHARRRRRGAGRGLVRRARAGRAAGGAHGRRARARRGRRLGRATHGDGVAAGRALRRRGRRVPDPRPQRVRRPLGRRVGARDRRGALRVPRGRVAAAVDARAAAAALLAQGRRGDAGDRADGRGCGRPAAGPDPGRPRSSRWPCSPSRSAATCGGCGATGTPRRRARRRPRTRRPPRRSARHAARGRVRTGIAARAHVLAAAASCGSRSSRRTSPAASRPARSCGSRSRASSSSPWRSSCPPPPGASWPASSGRLLGLLVHREGPRHRVLRRPSTGRSTPSPTGATPGSASRRCATRSAARRRTWPSPARRARRRRCSSLTTLAVLRLTRVAAGHRRWSLRAVAALGVVWVLCWAFGAQLVSDAPDRLHERRRPGRPRGARGAGRRPGPRGLRRRDPPRPLPRHARPPAADRPARQGRPARVRRELRQGRGPGLLVLAAGRRRARRREPSSCRPPASRPGARFLTSPTFGGHQLAGALHHAVGRLGRQPAALRPARQERPLHAQPGVQAGRLADRRRRAVEQPRPGRRGRRSTTTTSSTTGATSATAARSSRTPRCPTSTSSRPCSASSSRRPTAARSSRRSTWCRATRRGRASRS